MINQKTIHDISEKGIFSELDTHFARLMIRLSGQDAPELFLAAALLSHATSAGHVCLDLRLSLEAIFPGDESFLRIHPLSQATDWVQKLKKFTVVGKPGDFKPLILDHRLRLYLYRYWDYENTLVNRLRALSKNHMDEIDPSVLRDGISRLFPQKQKKTTDQPQLAVLLAIFKQFCVISGGPGAGKTSLITKIIALILEQKKERDIRIALVAPTGKAAARLSESIRTEKETLPVEDDIKNAIPKEAVTIHRLLGTISGSPYFRYNANNPLPADMVIVDEASMVDLALMSKLVQAVRPDARLILLGDKSQLASVEAGAVLGDICDKVDSYGISKELFHRIKDFSFYPPEFILKKKDSGSIRECIIELTKSYRFGPHSGIHALSQSVNCGDSKQALGLLRDHTYNDIKWNFLPQPNQLSKTLKSRVINGYSTYLKVKDPEEMLRQFDRFRILCALKKGPYGVTGLNQLVEQILSEEKLINRKDPWYEKRPIMITKNDYDLGLFNGDVGIILSDPDSNHVMRAFFLSSNGNLRKFLPIKLPTHETVFAMTVHKAQGSEFDRTLLVLPDSSTPVLTRELIYTGITRARKHVEIWATEHVFCSGVTKRIERSSGLRDALWNV